MKFALDVPNSGKYGDPSTLVALAVTAEESGWDGFFIWDHLVSGGRSPVADTWTVLAAIAANTSRIRIGPMITPLARRRPWIVARQAATLDQLSEGRLILGVGLGQFSEKEFAAFGDEADPVVRGEMLDESLAILTGLLSGDAFEFTGRHHRVRKTIFRPAPVQPRIPIWVAGRWPNKAPLHRAAQRDGAFIIPRKAGLTGEMSIEETADMIEYLAARRTPGASFDHAHAGFLTGETGEDAAKVKKYGEAGVAWWLEHIYASRMNPAKLRAFTRKGPPRSA
jgi:alkanesulfonate monooxygenase SsuD/methylene tetrahydromethanopterin reductase-like flavin-dependent oxidoreductase (luciferase family)